MKQLDTSAMDAKMKADRRFIEYAKHRADSLRQEAKEKEIEAGAWDNAAATMDQFIQNEYVYENSKSRQ